MNNSADHSVSTPKDSIIIRTPQKEDAAAILEYCKIIGGESHNLTFGSEGIDKSIEEEQKFIEDTNKHPINRLWIAEVDGEIASFCDLFVAPKARMAHRAGFGLSVRKAFWHQGIATAMMKEIMNYAKAQSTIAIISIEVIEDNERAIALYERFGFQKVAYLKNFFHIQEQVLGAYIMEYEFSERSDRNDFITCD